MRVRYQSFLPPKIRGGEEDSCFKIWRKRGVIKNCSKIGCQLKGGRFSQKRGGCFQIVSSVFYQKSMFLLLLEYFFFFFCLVNILTCCNQQICFFMWFNFYQKMIYYEIYFLFPFIFKYIFCENFIINDIYLHLHFIKNFKYS